ncbi:hypothetical protein [Meiothermus rufus]|uniref:hypothetical protein n=1 Tax=Meiothermus rufus TaxID=604332 RepID=UPI0003FF30B3|nr:hypothetical protein [Meiothermus rufus]
MSAIPTLLALALNLPFAGPVDQVQILFTTGCSAPRGVQNEYRRMLDQEVLPLLLGERILNRKVRLVLAGVTGRSYTAPSWVMETPDPLSTSRLALERQRKELHRKALQAFDDIRKRTTAECRSGTETIAALRAAGERTRGSGRILVLTHGFEQSEIVNLYNYNLKLHLPEVRASIRKRVKEKIGLPNLKGQEVCFAGITSGYDANANARLTANIRLFWEELIAESGGKLMGYGVSTRNCSFL